MHTSEHESTDTEAKETSAIIEQRAAARISCCRIAKVSMILDRKAPWRRCIAPVVIRSVSCDGLRVTLLEDTARAPTRLDRLTVVLTGEARELEVPAWVAWCDWHRESGAATELGAHLCLEELRPKQRLAYSVWVFQLIRSSRVAWQA